MLGKQDPLLSVYYVTDRSNPLVLGFNHQELRYYYVHYQNALLDVGRYLIPTAYAPTPKETDVS